MDTEQQIYLLLAINGWMLVRHYHNARKFSRIELLVKQICRKLKIDL